MFSPAEWKRRGLIEKFKECFNKYADLLRYPDQEILNIVFNKDVLIIHARWNIITSTFRNEPVPCYSVDEIKDALGSPGIAHYTGSHKPWIVGKTFHHPYSLALRKLAEISGQRKIALILKIKSLFLPSVVKPKKNLPWDKSIIDKKLLK